MLPMVLLLLSICCLAAVEPAVEATAAVVCGLRVLTAPTLLVLAAATVAAVIGWTGSSQKPPAELILLLVAALATAKVPNSVALSPPQALEEFQYCRVLPLAPCQTAEPNASEGSSFLILPPFGGCAAIAATVRPPAPTFFSRARSAAAASSACISANGFTFAGTRFWAFHLSLLSSCDCSSISCCCSCCSRKLCSWRASRARRSRSAFWISAKLRPLVATSATAADHGAGLLGGGRWTCCCCCCCSGCCCCCCCSCILSASRRCDSSSLAFF
uniref:Putative secreted protein n=1 Tax=Anopheles darlingi TaxID=43151 RepID=A0A2M4D2W0_ANODA